MDKTTEELAGVVASIRIDALPPVAVHETKRRMLDSIACAVGAFHEPFCARIRAAVARHASDPGARVWITGKPSSIEMAGFANGTTVRYLDLSDTVLSQAAGHPSDMIPALVALAEARQASGARLIEAIVAAYELYCGLADAVAFQKRAVDQSTAAALGAAGGAARLLGLDEPGIGNALALALGANVNLYNVRTGALSDWKACAGPNAARNGVFAALLAAEGVTGPTAVFEGGGGFCDIVGPVCFALDPNGAPRIAATHLKAYPVCYHGQSAVHAATALAGSVDPDNIASVLVETYDVAHRVMANDPSRWAPMNRETADHSLPYTVGVTLKTGRLTAADFAMERILDPELRGFIAQIEVKAVDAFTEAYPAEARSRITVETTGGERRCAETIQPKGHAQNPLSDEELILKLDGLWPGSFAAEKKAGIADLVWGLDDAASIVPLVDMLCDLEAE